MLLYDKNNIEIESLDMSTMYGINKSIANAPLNSELEPLLPKKPKMPC